MDIIKPGRLSIGSLNLDMDSLTHARRTSSLFTPLLDDADDMRLFSPNVFGMNSGTKDLLNSYGGSSKGFDQKIFNSAFQESLLASPNPGVQYEHELLYDQEPTPIKRDLFGSPSPDELSDSGESCTSESSFSSIRSNSGLFTLSNFQIDSHRIKCPSCKQVLNLNAASQQKTIFNVREVHRHFNSCLNKKTGSSKSSKALAKDEKKIDSEIASNIARVRKAIGKFELQDRIKIMQSLYRLGKAASSKSYGPPAASSMSSIYADAPAGTTTTETMDSSDQQVLSLLYSNPKNQDSSEKAGTEKVSAKSPRGVKKRKSSPRSKATKSPAVRTQEKFRPQPLGTPTVEMMQSVFAVDRSKQQNLLSWDFVDEADEKEDYDDEPSMKRIRY